jgi:DNA modification methylase
MDVGDNVTQKIYCGNCMDVLKSIPDETVDLVVIDPPYYRCSQANYDYVFDNKEDWISWLIECSKLHFNKLKNSGSFYVFGGIGTKNGFAFWNYVERLSNLYTFLGYINWKRFRPKGYKGKHNNWGDCREDIAYFCKGKDPNKFHKQYMREAGLSQASKKRFQQTGVGLSCGNIWIDIPEAQLDGGMNRTMKHPDQKPVMLIERIISASSDVGDCVLDGFCGSGTTLVAAKRLKRSAIGIEMSEDYCRMCKERLNNVTLNLFGQHKGGD